MGIDLKTFGPGPVVRRVVCGVFEWRFLVAFVCERSTEGEVKLRCFVTGRGGLWIGAAYCGGLGPKGGSFFFLYLL